MYQESGIRVKEKPRNPRGRAARSIKLMLGILFGFTIQIGLQIGLQIGQRTLYHPNYVVFEVFLF